MDKTNGWKKGRMDVRKEKWIVRCKEGRKTSNERNESKKGTDGLFLIFLYILFHFPFNYKTGFYTERVTHFA